jgi:hypothetical protein
VISRPNPCKIGGTHAHASCLRPHRQISGVRGLRRFYCLHDSSFLPRGGARPCSCRSRSFAFRTCTYITKFPRLAEARQCQHFRARLDPGIKIPSFLLRNKKCDEKSAEAALSISSISNKICQDHDHHEPKRKRKN